MVNKKSIFFIFFIDDVQYRKSKASAWDAAGESSSHWKSIQETNSLKNDSKLIFKYSVTNNKQ